MANNVIVQTEVNPRENEANFGHQFKLTISLKNAKNPRLFWLEKTAQPYTAHMRANTWEVMNSIHVEETEPDPDGQMCLSTLFEDWTETAVNLENEDAQIVIDDLPAIAKKGVNSRKLEFAIIITNIHPDANPEGFEWAFIHAVQDLAYDGNTITQQDFSSVIPVYGQGKQTLQTELATILPLPGEVTGEFS